MIIKKKTWPEQFAALSSGAKKFDCRIADFDCSAGDTIVFEEWDPKLEDYTGRTLEKTIGYVLKTKEAKFWSKEEVEDKGFQILSLD
jgi:hypothetical protein